MIQSTELLIHYMILFQLSCSNTVCAAEGSCVLKAQFTEERRFAPNTSQIYNQTIFCI